MTRVYKQTNPDPVIEMLYELISNQLRCICKKVLFFIIKNIFYLFLQQTKLPVTANFFVDSQTLNIVKEKISLFPNVSKRERKNLTKAHQGLRHTRLNIVINYITPMKSFHKNNKLTQYLELFQCIE